ncbi:hypothetical protein ACQPW3_11355 [Actinosynnema sp. CA-248983]
MWRNVEPGDPHCPAKRLARPDVPLRNRAFTLAVQRGLLGDSYRFQVERARFLALLAATAEGRHALQYATTAASRCPESTAARRPTTAIPAASSTST